MRARAIKDLSQLSDSDFISAVAGGIGLIRENAFRLSEDARILCEQERPQGHGALRSHAMEEAAKVLILLDAVRCPRQPASALSRHLGAFNEHLAKGIYAECQRGRPAHFSDVEEHINRLRREFYLDGPEGVDWIFRNSILDERERGLYVDYVETDEGHQWIEPFVYGGMVGRGHYSEKPVLSLVRALDDVGCLSEGALKVIATLWRPIAMTPEFAWNPELRTLNQQTLEAMDAKGLLRDAPPATYSKVIDEWLFPLYSLDLNKQIPVDKRDLRAVQDEYLYREMGVADIYYQYDE
jgi:AbiV family abortive infection protein